MSISPPLSPVFNLSSKPWWSFLTPDQQASLSQSLTLLIDEESHKNPDRFSDYSFVVFPAAKAYEGFLKKLFLQLNLITPQDYSGEHFRIGKSLNPGLKNEHYSDHVYTKLASYCGGDRLPQTLWRTWKQSRNLLFHWFPKEKNAITLFEARDRVQLIISSIDAAFSDCPLPRDKNSPTRL